MSANDKQVGGKHYTRGKIQCWDFIVDQGMDFVTGNAVKYLVRAGHKGNKLEDLEKARHYLDKLIELEMSAVMDAWKAREEQFESPLSKEEWQELADEFAEYDKKMIQSKLDAHI